VLAAFPSDVQINATVRVAILNGSTADLADVNPYAARFEVVGRDENPDIVWDVANEDVISGIGDVEGKNIKPAALAKIIDRVAAVAAMAKLSEERPQRITLTPNNKHHRAGEIVQFRAEDVKGKWIILFNIATDGKIQFLFPRSNDRVPAEETTFPLDMKVRPPFGADHLVAIASNARLPKLEEAISAFDNKTASGQIPGILRNHLSEEPSARIGFAGLFTLP
jgi:hypothetical protein